MRQTGLNVAVIVAAIIAIAVVVLVSHREKLALRAENSALRAEARELRTRNEQPTARPATFAGAPLADKDLRELMRLRAEVTRLRTEQAEPTNSRTIAAQPTNDSSGARPTFSHPFLTRAMWTNAGMATPRSALQTFLGAFTARNDAELANVSVRDTNNEPVKLTGKALDWQERLQGVQVLRYAVPDPKNHDAIVAVVLTEATIQSDVGDVLTHEVLSLKFEKIDGQWRFAGKK